MTNNRFYGPGKGAETPTPFRPNRRPAAPLAVVDSPEAHAVNGAQFVAGRLISGASKVGAVAQLGERLVRNEEVSGSIPLGSTNRQFPAESPFRCLQSNALLASLLNVRLK